MPCTSPKIVTWAGQALLRGDLDRLVPHYADTVAVFSPGAVYRLRGLSDLRAALEEHQQGLARLGVLGLYGRVAAIGMPRGQCYKLFVDWDYDLGSKRDPRRASATYFCRRGPHGPRVEMIEYRALAFKESRQWHAHRDLSARKAA